MTTSATTMRYPWERLRADRPLSSTAVILLLVLVTAFFTSSTLVQFDEGWEPWPAVTGGLFFPVLAVLLVLSNPARYRVVGLSVRQWRLDHGLLLALVAVAHLAWPVWALVDGIDVAQQVPGWTPLLPAAGIVAPTALVLHHYRRMLAGQVTGTGHRFAGTPWYYRVFLARRGPVAWRVVYQPVGTVSLAAVIVLVIWSSVDSSEVQMVAGGFLVAALATAPVVAASRTTAAATGMTRRTWVRHTMAAVALPQAVIGAVQAVTVSAVNGEMPLSSAVGHADPVTDLRPVAVATYLLLIASTALISGAFAVSVSFEDWGTAVMWLIFFNIVTGLIVMLGFTMSDALWPYLVAVALNCLVAFYLGKYAQRRTLLGQPDWTMTSIISGKTH